MYNWSVKEEELKQNPEKYAIWKLEQMVNFGLDGQKIDREKLKKYWSKINIDPARRRFLKILLLRGVFIIVIFVLEEFYVKIYACKKGLILKK